MHTVLRWRWGRGGRRVGVTLVLVALVITVCNGCSSVRGAAAASPGPSPSSVPGSPVVSPSAAATSEQAAVGRAYAQFWAVSWPLDRLPQAQWQAVMNPVAVDPELSVLLEATRIQQDNGITLYGQVVARVTSIEINNNQATLVDCQDASKAGQMELNNGKIRTVGVARSPITADLVRGSDSAWRVSRITYTGGTC